MEKFELMTPLKPAGDQPEAIEKLTEGLRSGKRYQTLLGVTGSGKTFTMAHLIARIQRPALVISHNKTLAAQLYAESNFNPFARSPAGAQGIAQFMPGTAQTYGLKNPFDSEAAIDAQAHLMRDLLRRFGSVPLALAAYNAGEGAVAKYGGIPPFPETQAYVAKIIALMGGAGAIPQVDPNELEVRLVS